MKVFVSGQIDETTRVRELYGQLEERGYDITHDWTCTDAIGDKRANREEAGLRAAKDISGVVESELYVLLSDNERVGKGMYAELGAALALRERTGSPEIFVVGPMNHLSIFYLHPAVTHVASDDELLTRLSWCAVPETGHSGSSALSRR